MLRSALLAFALTTWLAAPAFATSPPAPEAPLSRSVTLSAVVTIDAAGHVTALDWSKYQGLEALVAPRLDAVVRAWEFVPGAIDGVPMETRTELHVTVTAVALPDGSAALTVNDAKTGPGGDFELVPRTPREAFFAGDDAVVNLAYAVDADGRATVVSLDVKATGNKRAFERDLRAAVKRWRFVPETVGGRPQPGKGRLVYRQCIETCGIELPSDWSAGEKRDSTLAIKNDVRGQRI